MTASEPVQTTVHLTEKFRCNLCGTIFEYLPEDIKKKEKYDEKFLAHIVLHKCFYGVAFSRDAAFGNFSASVISEQFKKSAKLLHAIYKLIVMTLISDDILAFDDTKIKIQPEEKGGSKSGWASCFVSRHAVVYSLNRDHGGKTLKEFLKNRPNYLQKPVVLSDALPSYEGYKKDVIDAHCLTHLRRRFKLSEEDPEYSTLIINLIGEIYEVDSKTKNFSDIERLRVHEQKSSPIFDQLLEELEDALDSKRFLPNSELYKASNYAAKEQEKLRVFLKEPGVPLDTNHVERKIKSPIRLRKHAPIFKTESGAEITGELLTIVETAIHVGVRPRPYLEWALRGAMEGRPAKELTPWVFKQYHEREGPRENENSEKVRPKAEKTESQNEMATN